MNRQNHLSYLDNGQAFDVVVIGGGVSGGPLYNALCREGYRTALLDKGDFACGTSQASGMMVWGGLLYLKKMDLLTVSKMCAARDGLVESFPNTVSSRMFRFLPAIKGGQSPMFVMMGLYLYWLLGRGERHFPWRNDQFAESDLVREGRVKTSLMFEEAFLKHSDSRYVLDWIKQFNSVDNVPLNHCAVVAGRFDPSADLWHLDVRDSLTGTERQIRSKVVINCCGVWTDSVNAMLGITSKYRHVMSKGVYINIPRAEEHRTPLIFEMDDHDDVITYVPWGPVSMWGPTETAVNEVGPALSPNVDDIRFLLNRANKNLKSAVGAESIVSMRCGIRPLAVDRGYSKSEYPLELSRKYAINLDRDCRAISVYGGKLTTSVSLANRVLRKLDTLRPSAAPRPVGVQPQVITAGFPGVPDQVSPEWARDNEFCCTLVDYLRRRTNISQWTHRRGLGKNDQFQDELHSISQAFVETTGVSAVEQVRAYREKVKDEHDLLLESV